MVKLGDVIIFDDKHKLYCQDVTKIDIEIPNNTILYTDPPYNAQFNGRSGDHKIIINDDMNDDEFYVFIETWYKKIVLKNNFDAIYIWCNNYLKGIIEKIEPNKWLIKNKRPIIWVKNNFGMGKNYRPKYEMLMFDGKIDEDIKNECDIWEIPKDNGDTYIHPTQKPKES